MLVRRSVCLTRGAGEEMEARRLPVARGHAAQWWRNGVWNPLLGSGSNPGR